MKQNITPLSRIETIVYLPNVAGGFDVRGCPDAENLAAFIVKACNSHDDLVRALKGAYSIIVTEVADGYYTEGAVLARAALATAGAE